MLKLGSIIDKLRAKDLAIVRAERVVKDLKAERKRLETKALKAFNKDDIDGAKGKAGIANISESSHPQIKDRKKFLKYVIARRAWDLFQNRIANRAYFDRLEEGESVPGVEVFKSIRVRVRARK